MGLKRWIENRTFRKGIEEEYQPIKVRFNSCYLGEIQLFRHKQTNSPLIRLVGTKILDSAYIDISPKGARELITQLEDALIQGTPSRNSESA